VDFGQALRYIRERAGLSLRDLARATNYHKTMIGHVETGARRTTVELARACDRALGTKPILAILAVTERQHRPDASASTRESAMLAALADALDVIEARLR